MSLSILLSTAGIPVFAHTCNMSGATEVSVMPEAHSCCSDETDEEAAEDNGASCKETTSCCTLQTGYYKTEAVATSAQQKDQKLLLPLYLLTIIYYSNTLKSSAEDLSLSHQNYTANAPPSGRNLLNKIQVFRI